MSGISKFKRIYSEGVVDYTSSEEMEESVKVRKGILRGSQSQIKKSSGASALTPSAAAQLGPKAVELQRTKAKQVDVPSFVKTIRTEEAELEEGMTMSDFKKQRSRQKQKEKRAADKISPTRRAGIHADKASPERASRHRANVDPDFEGDDESQYPGGKLGPKKVRKAKALGELGEAHWDPATKTISDKKRTGTDPEIQKMAAKAAASGPKKRKPLGSVRKNSSTFIPSSPEQAKADKKSWDTYWEGSWKNKGQNEAIDVGADAGETISDFVHSKSKTLKGDSKKQRIKRALGAYYAAQKEETENIYNYVIETLVATDYAESYETAENMFEHMSSEFVAVILEDYIEEAKRSRTERRAANAGKKGYDAKGNSTSRVSKTHVIHDVDDNVADQRHPDAAKIDLYKNNSGSYKHVKSMTPSEFAHTPLERKHTYGFNAFRDTDKFKKTTKKTKVAGMGDSGRRSAKKSVVTARGGSPFGSNKPSTPMDKPGSFVSDLKDRIGVKGLERKDTHFTGGMNKGSNKGLSGPEKKAKVVSKIAKPSDKKIITTDDHLGNTRAMSAAASAAAPQSKVKAYQSRPSTKKPKGKGKVGDIVPSRVGKENKPGDTNIGIRANTNPSKSTKETQQRRKKARKNMGEEMSSYEYWKKFID
jgi:hypothetical protein